MKKDLFVYTAITAGLSVATIGMTTLAIQKDATMDTVSDVVPAEVVSINETPDYGDVAIKTDKGTISLDMKDFRGEDYVEDLKPGDDVDIYYSQDFNNKTGDFDAAQPYVSSVKLGSASLSHGGGARDTRIMGVDLDEDFIEAMTELSEQSLESGTFR